jgi:hypothetical protein
MGHFVDKSITAVIINRRLILRAIFTLVVLGFLFYVVRLLFHAKADGEFKDLINVVLGAMLVSYSKIIDYWFRRDDEDKREERIESTLPPV